MKTPSKELRSAINAPNSVMGGNNSFELRLGMGEACLREVRPFLNAPEEIDQCNNRYTARVCERRFPVAEVPLVRHGVGAASLSDSNSSADLSGHLYGTGCQAALHQNHTRGSRGLCQLHYQIVPLLNLAPSHRGAPPLTISPRI